MFSSTATAAYEILKKFDVLYFRLSDFQKEENEINYIGNKINGSSEFDKKFIYSV